MGDKHGILEFWGIYEFGLGHLIFRREEGQSKNAIEGKMPSDALLAVAMQKAALFGSAFFFVDMWKKVLHFP